MKRFYGLLFAATLVGGAAYGMEVDIRDYADVIEHLTTAANFRAEDDFEDAPIQVLQGVEDFVVADTEKQGDSYLVLCVSYLNKVFALRECDVQQIERMLRERFIGGSEKALYYADYKQFVVGQLQLDELHPVITEVCKSKDADAILDWLLLFDGTGNMCETMLVRDGLCQIIPPKKGLATSIQPEERVLLQKAKGLQGQGKEFIDTLREKDQEDKDQRQQLRAQAEKRKDEIVTQIFNALKAPNQEIRLDKLLQEELIGDDAPLGEYRDYINEEIQARLNHPRLINFRENLLNRWNVTFAKLPITIKSEPTITVGTNPLDNPVIDQPREPKDSTVDESQKRTVDELIEEGKAKNPTVELPQQPDIGGGQPRPDAPKGITALFAAITAPKLALMAVVVGVGYWGYTKYKAYKSAQEEKQKEAENKQNVTNKQSARKQQPVRKQRAR